MSVSSVDSVYSQLLPVSLAVARSLYLAVPAIASVAVAVQEVVVVVSLFALAVPLSVSLVLRFLSPSQWQQCFGHQIHGVGAGIEERYHFGVPAADLRSQRLLASVPAVPRAGSPSAGDTTRPAHTPVGPRVDFCYVVQLWVVFVVAAVLVVMVV